MCHVSVGLTPVDTDNLLASLMLPCARSSQVEKAIYMAKCFFFDALPNPTPP